MSHTAWAHTRVCTRPRITAVGLTVAISTWGCTAISGCNLLVVVVDLQAQNLPGASLGLEIPKLPELSGRAVMMWRAGDTVYIRLRGHAG